MQQEGLGAIKQHIAHNRQAICPSNVGIGHLESSEF